jgi:hypothetical protein
MNAAMCSVSDLHQQVSGHHCTILLGATRWEMAILQYNFTHMCIVEKEFSMEGGPSFLIMVTGFNE